MNNLMQTLIQSNTLNLLVVLAVLVLVVLKLNIGKNLETSKDEIKSFVNESENEKSDAEKRLSNIQEKIKKLPSEIKSIEKATKNNIESLEKKSLENIEEKKADIDNNVNRIMNLETKKFKSKLTALISEASVNLARDNALKQLEDNRSMHDKYINDAIDEIDGMIL